jgi:glycogen operon protein
MFNGHHEPVSFTVPTQRWGARWVVEVDTAAGAVGPVDAATSKAGDEIEVAGRSVVLLRHDDDAVS